MTRWVWNARERRPRAVFRVIMQTLLLVAVGLGGRQIVVRLLRPAGLMQGRTASMALSSLALFGGVLLAAKLFDRRRLSELGLRAHVGGLVDLAAGVLLGAFLMGGIAATELALDWAHFSLRVPSAEEGSLMPALWTSCAIFVGVALFEEAFSRGYHLTNLAEGLAKPGLITRRAAIAVALVLSSMIFGLMHVANDHATVISTINIMLAGVFLGAGYIWSGELAFPIGLHFGWNFFQGALGMPVSGHAVFGNLFVRRLEGPELLTGGEFGPEAGVTGVVAMLVGLALTAGYMRLRRGMLRVDRSIASPPRDALLRGAE